MEYEVQQRSEIKRSAAPDELIIANKELVFQNEETRKTDSGIDHCHQRTCLSKHGERKTSIRINHC